MAILYVSKTATNGYVVGNDANNGTSKALAKLTVASAITAAVNGDEIKVNDGTYSHATFFNTSSKGITINPENAYKVTLDGTDATQVLQCGHTAGLTLTIGALILDGKNTAARCVNVTGDVALATTVFNGTKFIRFTEEAVHSVKSNEAITFNNTIVEASLSETNKLAALFYKDNALTGSVTVNGGRGTVTNTASASRSFVRVTRASGSSPVVVTIRDIRGLTLISNVATGGTGWRLYSGFSVDDSVIERNHVTFDVAQDVTAIQVRAASDVSPTAHRAVVRYNVFRVLRAVSGYGVVIGPIATGTNSHRANNAEVYGNTIIWETAPLPGVTPHGIAFSYATGCRAYGNTVIGAYAPFLNRGIDCSFVGNKADKVYGRCCYSKGSTNGLFAQNVLGVIAVDNTTGALSAVVGEDATNTTKCKFVMNVVVVSGPAVNVVNVTPSQDVDFYGNRYVSTRTLNFILGASTYTNLKDWNAVATVEGDYLGPDGDERPINTQLAVDSSQVVNATETVRTDYF